MRLSSWTVRGYKSLSEATLDVDEQKLLVGKNDSGKSNLLDSLNDYTRLFGEYPDSFVWGENRGYDNWWQLNNSRYTDGNISFTARFELEDEEEHETLIRNIGQQFEMAPGWDEDRLDSGDFRHLEHKSVLNQDGVQSESLRTTIHGEFVPVTMRQPGTQTCYRLLYAKIGRIEEEAAVSQVTGLVNSGPGTIEEVSITNGEMPGVGDWYRKHESVADGDRMGGILSQPYYDILEDAIRRWKKIRAFRIPDPRSSESEDGEDDPGELEMRSDMADLVDYLAQIDYQDNLDSDIETVDEKYQSIIETVGGIDIRPPRNADLYSDELTVVVREFDENFDFEVISDGAMQAICLVTQLHKSGMNSGLLMIEEPEVHLHADAIRRIWDYIEMLVEANNLQLIATTHSQTVINRTDPEELALFAREPQTVVEKVKVEDLSKTLAPSDSTIGGVAQAEVVVFIEGELMTRLIQAFCASSELRLSKYGVQLFCLDGPVMTELERYQALLRFLSGSGIDTRFFVTGQEDKEVPQEENEEVPQEEDEEVPQEFREWKQTFDDTDTKLIYDPLIQHNALDWIRIHESDLVDLISEEAGVDITLQDGELHELLRNHREDQGTPLSTSDVVQVINNEAEGAIRRSDVISILPDLRFEEPQWTLIRDRLSGVLPGIR